MNTLLDRLQMELLEADVPESRWGSELRYYVTGDAASYWMYLKQSGISLKDWPTVRAMFRTRFCRDSREAVIKNLHCCEWQGNDAVFSSTFAAIVAKGEDIPQQELISLYLAKLPTDLYLSITKEGSRTFETWHEAAAAVRQKVGSRQAALDLQRRAIQYMADVYARTGEQKAPPRPPRGRSLSRPSTPVPTSSTHIPPSPTQTPPY